MQNWFIIDEKYLDYLRKEEQRIPYSDYGSNKFKLFLAYSSKKAIWYM